MSRVPDRYFYSGLIAFLILLLMHWLHVYWQTVPANWDILWLTECFRRYIQGRDYISEIFEVNPPLNFLIYAPLYALINISRLPLEHANLILGLFYVLLSTLAVWRALKLWHPDLAMPDIFLVTMSFLLVNTLGLKVDFGQRDHLILLGLAPMLLVQLAITDKLKMRHWFKYAVLIAGAIMIMVRPHYGLLPVIVLCNRMWRQKRLFNIALDEDFIVLAMVTAGYAIGLLIFFPNYIFHMLPDIYALYIKVGITHDQYAVIIRIGWAFFITINLALLYMVEMGPQRRKIAFWFLNASAISLFIYIVMNRSYLYHLVPCIAFLTMSFSLTLFSLLGKNFESRLLVVTVTAFIIVFCMIISRTPFPTREQLQSFSLTRIVRECGTACRSALWEQRMTITLLTTSAAEAEIASRFPSTWYVKQIREAELAAKNETELARARDLHNKFATYAGEDLQRYKPEIIINCDNAEEKNIKSYIDFFSASPLFVSEFRNYKKDKVLQVNENDYLRRVEYPPLYMTCEVYKRY